MDLNVVEARSAIESLRSGVPSRHAVAQLGTTQSDIKERFVEALHALKSGEAARPLVVSANFGGGKSHLLNYLRTLAERERFVTSYVVVSPEMPLGNAHLVLKAIAENAKAPDRVGKALRALTSDQRTDTAAFADLRLWARGETTLDDRFRALLHLYEASVGDDEFRLRILDDFEGKPLLKTLVRQKLKEIGELGGYDLRASPRNPLLAHDRIRLYARFVRACGCHGLIVLFDELERVAKFSIRQRLLAYEEMGWWKEAAEQAGSAVLPVFAVTRNFKEETVTGGTRDEQRFQSSVLGYAQDERDQRALAGIALFKDPYYFSLEPPDPEQMEEIKYRLKNIYEQAYGITVPILPPDRQDVSTTVRSEIRRWITQWDLHRHYPQYAARIETGEITFDASEIADDTLPPDDDEDESAAAAV